MPKRRRELPTEEEGPSVARASSPPRPLSHFLRRVSLPLAGGSSAVERGESAAALTRFRNALQHVRGRRSVHAIAAAPRPSDSSCFLIRFDGGARGDPGLVAGAGILWAPVRWKLAGWDPARDVGGRIRLAAAAALMPQLTTINRAEYVGLIAGLKLAETAGARHVLVEGDSLLVVEQLNGALAVTEPAQQVGRGGVGCKGGRVARCGGAVLCATLSWSLLSIDHEIAAAPHPPPRSCMPRRWPYSPAFARGSCGTSLATPTQPLTPS